MTISNVRIAVRLGVGFGLLILLLCGIALVGATRLSNTTEKTKEIVHDRYAKVALVNNIAGDVNDAARAVRNAMLTGDLDYKKDQLKIIADTNAKIETNFGKLASLINTDTGRENLKTLSDAARKYEIQKNKLLEILIEGDINKTSEYLFKEVIPPQRVYFAELEKMAKFQAGLMTTYSDSVILEAESAQVLIYSLSAIAMLLAITTAFFITRSIVGPINHAVNLAESVASGDLTRDIQANTRDEVGHLLKALKSMNENLQKIVGQVRTGTDTIATASSEIATGNLDLSSRTEEQASSLEEIASSMEELSSTVKQNADNARQANQMAANASIIAVRGGTAVGNVINTMNTISASSNKIVDIISVIDGIAFQTNILALNAAVEAARAGEQGRGFAVVASEVRSLAQRSASAAKEIKILISESVAQVNQGGKMVADAGATLNEVVASVKQVTDIVAEISAASQEQSSGLEQINLAITQMDEVTQQNAALVEEAAAAAQSLQDQAHHLVEAVSVFKLHDQSIQVALAPRPRMVNVTPEPVRLANRALTVPRITKSDASSQKNMAASDWEQF